MDLTLQPSPSPQMLLTALMVDIYQILRLNPNSPYRHLVNGILRPPLLRFCQIFAETDLRMAREGFVAASGWLVMTWFAKKICLSGSENIPKEGPLVVVSNHPGAFDSAAISTSLGRDDLAIIASDSPFLMRLPTISQHLIFISPDSIGRMDVIRKSIRHLQSGGALLVFPTGLIDPDPAFMAGSEAVMDTWSNSVEIFMRKVNGVHLLPLITSGILQPKMVHHLLTRLEKERWKRQRIAEFLQLATQVLFPKQNKMEVNISFGAPADYEMIKNEWLSGSFKDSLLTCEKALLKDHQEHFGLAPALLSS